MGNAQVKASASFAGKQRGKLSKSVHWSHAERPPPPGKPRLVPGTPHSQAGVVTIRWDPPPRHGGAPVTGYLVEHRRAGTPHWVRSTPAPTLRPEAALSGLEPGWRYQFRVSAESAAGRSEPGELSEPLTVTLDRPQAQPPLFTAELRDAVALENDKVEFVVQFRGTPAPAISWFKDGFEIFSSRRMKVVTEAEQSSLVIFQAAFSDEGEFKCAATNRVGHAVTRCKLRLEAPPRIRLPRQYEDGLLFERDEVIRLKVSVLGRPLPRVTWHHNGEPVAFGGRHEVVNTERGSQLRVAEARRSDRGEYLVRATSRLGEDHAAVLVTVTDIPHPPGKVKVVSALGRSVTLSWSEPDDDGGCKIGNYIVEYYRLGWNVWLKAATCRQLSTILGDLIEGSEYKFRVKAENPYGVSEPSEESDTVFIPDPKRGLMDPPAKRATLERDVPLIPGGRATTSEDHLPTVPREPVAKRSASLTRADDQNKQTLVIDITGKRGNLKAMSPAGKPDVPENLGDAIRRSEVKKPPSSAIDTNKVSSEKPNALRSSATGSGAAKSENNRDGDSVVPVKPVRTAHGAKEAARGVSTWGSAAAAAAPAAAVPAGRVDDDSRPLTVVQHENENDRLARRRELVRRGSSQGPREQDDRLVHGSSELMLLLVPQEEGQKEQRTPRDSEERLVRAAAGAAAAAAVLEREESVAPPMSLSAPELGGEDPAAGGGGDPGGPLRNAVSSTELLHDRANARFFQEAEQRRMLRDRERAEQQQRQARTLVAARAPPPHQHPLHRQATDTSEEAMEEDSLEESDESADERDFEAEENRAWRSRLQRGLADRLDDEEDTYHPPRVLAAAPAPAPVAVPAPAAAPADAKAPPAAPAQTAWERVNGALPQQQQKQPPQETALQNREAQAAASEDKERAEEEEDEREDEEAQLRAAAEAARRRRIAMASRQASLEEEAAMRQAVSSHYGELISDLASRRSLRPRAYAALLDADQLKAAADDAERRQASPVPEEDSAEAGEDRAEEEAPPEHELKGILKSAKVAEPATPAVARAPPRRMSSEESGPAEEEEEEEVQQRFREDTPVVRERLGGASPLRSLGRSPLLLHQLGRSRSSEDSYSYDDDEDAGPATVPARYHLLEEEEGGREPAPMHRDDGAPLRIPARALARSSSREESEDADPERVYRERLEQLRREQREWEARRRREEQLWELRRRQLQLLQPQAPPPPEVVRRRVRSWFEFLSDAALLGVACWLYLFVDELLVVPLLVFLVYGQLSAAVRRRLPRLPRLPFRRRQPAPPQDQ
ncbi:uncharacterized protein LOC124613014 [Schistocerca americana]|uniref:uncharacterized protein LOC124613014 n=1 Tax=Schistocerca americana TaxID=7009 RepID=UPI001F4FBAA3|nr:uncharacterized protein LOC124613014 [Schistocerca americana]